MRRSLYILFFVLLFTTVVLAETGNAFGEEHAGEAAISGENGEAYNQLWSKADDSIGAYRLIAFLGIVVSLLFSIARYMFAYFYGDNQYIGQQRAKLMDNLTSALFIVLLISALAFNESMVAKMFGKETYSQILSELPKQLQYYQNILETTIPLALRQYEAATVSTNYEVSWLTIPVMVGPCAFGDIECLNAISKKTAKLQAYIDLAYSFDLSFMIADAIYRFFVIGSGDTDYDASGYLLFAGLAFYSFELTRKAGAAFIALGLSAFYAFPIAYYAFSVTPSAPNLTPPQSYSEAVKDIQSCPFCSVSTVPSVYIKSSEATRSYVASASTGGSGGSLPLYSINTMDPIDFMNSIYNLFLLRASAALSTTFIIASYLYLILSKGMPGSFLTGLVGGYI